MKHYFIRWIYPLFFDILMKLIPIISHEERTYCTMPSQLFCAENKWYMFQKTDIMASCSTSEDFATSNALLRLREQSRMFSTMEREIAAHILQNPQLVVDMSIHELARPNCRKGLQGQYTSLICPPAGCPFAGNVLYNINVRTAQGFPCQRTSGYGKRKENGTLF